MATATKARAPGKKPARKPAAKKAATTAPKTPNLTGKSDEEKKAAEEAAAAAAAAEAAKTPPEPEIAPDEPENDLPEDFLTIDKTGTPFVQAYCEGRYIEFPVIEITGLEQQGNEVICHLSGTTIMLRGPSEAIADLFTFVRQFAAARRNAR